MLRKEQNIGSLAYSILMMLHWKRNVDLIYRCYGAKTEYEYLFLPICRLYEAKKITPPTG